MKKIIKKFSLQEMALLLDFMKENEIELGTKVKKPLKNIDNEKAELLIKFIIEMKLDVIKDKLLMTFDKVDVSRYKAKSLTMVDRWLVKVKVINDVIPFIKDCNAERLYKILQYNSSNARTILRTLSYGNICDCFKTVAMFMVAHLNLKEYDDNLQIITHSYIGDFYAEIEGVEKEEAMQDEQDES